MGKFNLERARVGYPVKNDRGDAVIKLVVQPKGADSCDYPIQTIILEDETGMTYHESFTLEGVYHISQPISEKNLVMDESRTPVWINLWRNKETRAIVPVVYQTWEHATEDMEDPGDGSFEFIKTVNTILEDKL